MGINTKNALICPLDWGLGHVSRIIPIIRKLQEQSFNVYISCSKKQYYFLKNEGLNFEWIPTEFPEIRYSNKKINLINLFNLLFKTYFGIIRDKNKLKKILKKQTFNLIISDNRYGCYSSKVYSVIVTHQLNIKLPSYIKWAEPLVNIYVKYRLNKFDECWVPDVPNKTNYAGVLSIKHNLPVKYVGLLSRFENIKSSAITSTPPYEVLGIISGPEPQKTIFFKILLQQMKLLGSPCAIAYGNPEADSKVKNEDNVTIYNHSNGIELYSLIQSSKNIVARSGYSTIMDLIILKRTAILVPTPGQPEQEYLAEYYQMRKLFVIQQQSSFSLTDALSQLSVYTMNHQYIPNHELDEAIENLL